MLRKTQPLRGPGCSWWVVTVPVVLQSEVDSDQTDLLLLQRGLPPGGEMTAG